MTINVFLTANIMDFGNSVVANLNLYWDKRIFDVPFDLMH
jgi:hypothetical protein